MPLFLMLFLLGIFVGVSVFLVVLAFTANGGDVIDKAISYLDEGESEEPSFRERVLLPIWRRISRLGGLAYPPNTIARLDHYCLLAGRPFSMNGELLAGMKLFLALFAALLALLFVHGSIRPVASVLAACIAYILPGLFIQRRIALRLALARNQLADAMDLMVVSVEAGLGIDSAMSRVSEKLGGPVGDGFGRALSEISLGESREKALRGIVDRLPVDEIKQFVSSLIQAEQLGISIGDMLRAQADVLRRRRRLKAEEHARRAPIKILFPMVLFIFPAIFVVVLGPAVINILRDLPGK